MKSSYLHHAVEGAFKELIPDDSIPSYFLYLEVDPQTIDVNIHPTKTEINFQDIKSIYAILHSAVKQSIGKFNLSPSIDFEVEQSLNYPVMDENRPVKQPVITINPEYNPFEKKTEPQTHFTFPSKFNAPIQGWQDLYAPTPAPRLAEMIEFPHHDDADGGKEDSPPQDESSAGWRKAFQVHRTWMW